MIDLFHYREQAGERLLTGGVRPVWSRNGTSPGLANALSQTETMDVQFCWAFPNAALRAWAADWPLGAAGRARLVTNGGIGNAQNNPRIRKETSNLARHRVICV